ncbi:tetratricopeptide repeat protein [Lutispora thermophila]|uniref:Tetratricopeptide repeat-containing protein n=1 Tax=Lutispora thermophila DSM 19022 TaxID=1122184 RepID=A0A1M6BAP4_9FIRM|nr:tetratricopeptide repeat protein [Lutispora thermophila]SHI45737.1 Tetratricopeptide repeat-containing protein [Lutispora thermophila DSM 19022]
MNTAINLYRNLIENHSYDPWAKRAYVRLAEIYLYMGEYEEAEKYLLSEKDKADSNFIYDLYNSWGKYDKGIELLEDLIQSNNSNFDIDYYDNLAQLYIQSQKYEEAIKTYKKALARIEDFEKRYEGEECSTIEKERLNRKIAKAEELRKGEVITGECRGRVIVDGIGVEGVRVYIKDKFIYEEEFIGGSIGLPFTLTDKEGYYLIDNLLPWEYDIGIGINPERIFGKAYLGSKDNLSILKQAGVLVNNFEFNTAIEILSPDDKIEVVEDRMDISWRQIGGAASYGLVIGLINENGYISSVYMKDIDGKADTDSNKVTIYREQLGPHFMGFLSFYDDDTPTPETLLGFYGGAKVLYGIEAYDEDGNLIGSSMPVIKSEKYPRYFVLISQELEGDKLIKKKISRSKGLVFRLS